MKLYHEGEINAESGNALLTCLIISLVYVHSWNVYNVPARYRENVNIFLYILTRKYVSIFMSIAQIIRDAIFMLFKMFDVCC